MRLLMLIVVLLVSGAAVPAVAGPLEDGLEAYEKGDYATALRLWRPLAEQGNADAQSNLGTMYYKGQGLTQDYVQAHMWWNLSAAQGEPGAAKNRDLVARTMTPTMIGEAQKLAREWKPK